MTTATVDEPGVLPVFLCYRRDDGSDIAFWLYQKLNETPIRTETGDETLHVYFDQGAAAVGDWTKVHEPWLKRARALIFVSTPGAGIRLGEHDWVYTELDWWLDHRDTAPIVVEPKDLNGRYLPESITVKKLSPQRVVINPASWAPADAAAHETRVLRQIREAIGNSSTAFLKQELEKERLRQTEHERNKDELEKANGYLKGTNAVLVETIERLKTTKRGLCVAIICIFFLLGAGKFVDRLLKDPLRVYPERQFEPIISIGTGVHPFGYVPIL